MLGINNSEVNLSIVAIKNSAQLHLLNGIQGNESLTTEAFENPDHDNFITFQRKSNSRNQTTHILSTR